MTNTATNPEPEAPNAEQFLSPARFALTLAALLAVTFWRVLFGGEAFFYRDYGFLGYPFAHFHRECFWSGDFFPLWNPYVNCGAPYLAQWNTLCLYPGALIYLVLPLPWSLGFFCVAHLFLGGMGMRALAERWTGSRFGAAVAGVAFVFSGLVLGCVIYPNYLVALGWMPWVVLATRLAWQEGGRSVVLAALAGAMQMLAGAPEIILLTWGFLAALMAVDWVQGSRFKVQGLPAQDGCGTTNASSLTPALSRWEREGASETAEPPTAPLTKPAIGDSTPKSEAASLNPTQSASPPLPAGEGRGEGERVPGETTAPHSPHRPTNHFSLITRFLSVIALITGLCAAQLLPFFQLLSLSQRSGDAVNTFWSLPGWGWVNLFFPLFMNFQTEQGVFVMIGQSFFPSVYLGIVPLTLALLAVWRIGLRGVGCPPFRVSAGTDTLKRGHQTEGVWEVRLLAGATLLAVLLAMGDNFVLWRWLREALPLGVVRFPVKALLLAAFTVPLLAAWGVEWLLRDAGQVKWELARRNEVMLELYATPAGRDWKILWQAAMYGYAAIVVASIYWPIPIVTYQSATAIASWPFPVVGLISVGVGVGAFGGLLLRQPNWQRRNGEMVVLLMTFGAGVFHIPHLNPTIPAAAFEPGAIAAYHAQKGALTPAPKLGESRIMLSPQAERALHTRMVPKFYDDFIGQRLAFWGNLNLLDGLPKVNGASTLVTREWNDVEYFLYGTTNPAPANLMDFLGVTHTTKPGELMQWERRESAMPLVSAGQEIQPYDDGSQSVGALLGPNWNPHEMVFIPANTSTNRAVQVTATVRIRHFQPRAGDLQSPSASNDSDGRRLQTAGTDAGATSLIKIEAEAAAPTVLVFAQTFYPSWRATVNGQLAPILRANHAFQAIPIPAGKSTIRLDYVDWPFRIGALISLATALGCVLMWRRGSS